MKYKELKREAFEANLDLQARGLVLYTWGNVSQVDRDEAVLAIKPSGVAYAHLTPEDMVIVDFDNAVVEGRLKPSSDTRTHLPHALNLCHRLGTGTTGHTVSGDHARGFCLRRNTLHGTDDRRTDTTGLRAGNRGADH